MREFELNLEEVHYIHLLKLDLGNLTYPPQLNALYIQLDFIDSMHKNQVKYIRCDLVRVEVPRTSTSYTWEQTPGGPTFGQVRNEQLQRLADAGFGRDLVIQPAAHPPSSEFDVDESRYQRMQL